jgi:hypothetical protein
MKKWTKAELIQCIEELKKVAQANKDLAERAVRQVEERDNLDFEETVESGTLSH